MALAWPACLQHTRKAQFRGAALAPDIWRHGCRCGTRGVLLHHRITALLYVCRAASTCPARRRLLVPSKEYPLPVAKLAKLKAKLRATYKPFSQLKARVREGRCSLPTAGNPGQRGRRAARNYPRWCCVLMRTDPCARPLTCSCKGQSGGASCPASSRPATFATTPTLAWCRRRSCGPSLTTEQHAPTRGACWAGGAQSCVLLMQAHLTWRSIPASHSHTCKPPLRCPGTRTGAVDRLFKPSSPKPCCTLPELSLPPSHVVTHSPHSCT